MKSTDIKKGYTNEKVKHILKYIFHVDNCVIPNAPSTSTKLIFFMRSLLGSLAKSL